MHAESNWRTEMSLDPFDLKILSVLQDNAYLSNAELATQVGLSPSQCSRFAS